MFNILEHRDFEIGFTLENIALAEKLAALKVGKSTKARASFTGWKRCAPVSRLYSINPLPGSFAARSSTSSPHGFALV